MTILKFVNGYINDKNHMYIHEHAMGNSMFERYVIEMAQKAGWLYNSYHKIVRANAIGEGDIVKKRIRELPIEPTNVNITFVDMKKQVTNV
jgi:hypothetical protein